MKVWEAMTTILAFEYDLNGEDYERELPRLAKKARQALREIGTTNEEMESEFPDESLYEGLYLIKHNPSEFKRRSINAMHQVIGRN